MSLSEIKNKLYKKDEEAGLSSHEFSEFDPVTGAKKIEEIKGTEKDQGDNWKKEQKGFDAFQNDSIRKGAIALGIIIGIIVLMLAVYFIRKSLFSTDRVLVGVNGAKQVESGKLVTYEITYNNNNYSSLKNAVLKITYPDTFKPEDNANFKSETPTFGTYELGTLAGHEQKKILFNGRTFSPRGALMYLKAELTYSPSGFSSKYVSSMQFDIGINSSPISIEVMSPQNVSSGDEVNYLVSYSNNGQVDFANVQVKVDYPEGYTFSRSEPAAAEGNNIWYIGNLSPGQKGQITVMGKLEGNRDQIREVKASVGAMENGNFVSYNEQSSKTKISSSSLAIYQTVNGQTSLDVNAGELLRFEIFYSNQGDIGLRDVIVTESIDSPVLDYSTLDLNGGYYDSNKKTIIWKASDDSRLRNLDRGASGSIVFSIKVKDVIPMASANDKNFVVSSLAKIDSPDIPTPVSTNKIIAGNKMDMKLNSKLVLNANGYYYDSVIANSGPIPPKVGQETTYTMHWVLANVSNNVENARIEATLPTGVSMTGKIIPEDAKVSYNERTNLVTWDIGNIEAGEGILSAPREASFQIKINPSIEQVGREVGLLGESILSARDAFTGEILQVKAKEKNTQLIEDSQLEFRSKVTN